MAFQRSELTEPAARHGLAAAIGWLQDAMLGSAALSVAIIAVAGVGLLLLSGRLPARRGIAVVVGCFLVFGARGLASALTGAQSTPPEIMAARGATPSPLPQEPKAPQPFDPYAGASLVQ